jgi:bla regulator protein blaR1
MISKFLSDLSTSLAPALGNHIWQSTLFACAMGVLTLAFRGNQARVRYWLWLAASLKFLVPFSLLVAVGGRLASPHPSTPPNIHLYAALQQASEPFAQPVISQHAGSAASGTPTQLLPILLGVWLFGLLLVLAIWTVRWRRMSAWVRAAVPVHEGREVETLRGLERIGKISRPIQLLLAPTSMEPGIFGIARPVLVWPRGISERLDDAHLSAVLAHELWHVRRRDNLVASLHMLVEAVFWFHPLVWWMGTRLLEERERACDEEVLECGADRQAYAESILKICEFCVGTPLHCVSGVTGADLKKRIALIMSGQSARTLNPGRKLLLFAAGILALAAPIVAGLFHAAPARTGSQIQNTTGAVPALANFSIAPSKPGDNRAALGFGLNGFFSKNASLQQVIRAAYGVEDDRIVGGPAWLSSEKYDVEAKADNSGANDPRKLSFDQHISEEKGMLQALLADRLKLGVHRETRELSVYALVLAKGGPKLQEAKPGDTYPKGFKGPDGIARPGGMHFQDGYLIAQGVPVTPLLFHLSGLLHRTILDETGLSGTYDFTLNLPGDIPTGIDNPAVSASYESDLSAALERQVGLKLEPRTASMEVLIIDHVERPAASQARSTP